MKCFRDLSFPTFVICWRVGKTALEPVGSFKVEHFEGVEDPETISVEQDGPETLRVDLFFSCYCIILTVTMPGDGFRECQDEYSRHFMNNDITGGDCFP